MLPGADDDVDGGGEDHGRGAGPASAGGGFSKGCCVGMIAQADLVHRYHGAASEQRGRQRWWSGSRSRLMPVARLCLFVGRELSHDAGPRRTMSGTEGTRGDSTRWLGRTGERVSAIGLGGFHIGRSRDEAESIRDRPRRHRPRHHLPGQLLGLQRRRERGAHGQGAAGRLPRARSS